MNQSYSKELRDEVLQLISSAEKVLSPRARVFVIKLSGELTLAAIRCAYFSDSFKIVYSPDSLDFWECKLDDALGNSELTGFDTGDSLCIGKALLYRRKYLAAEKNEKDRESSLRLFSDTLRGY